MKKYSKQLKNKLCKKRPKLTIILYMLSIIFIVCFIYQFYDACVYIGNLMNQGQIVFGKSIGKIFQYMMSNTGSFLFFGISFLIYGKIVTYMKKDEMIEESACESEPQEEQ